jgi:hypothetical protein
VNLGARAPSTEDRPRPKIKDIQLVQTAVAGTTVYQA